MTEDGREPGRIDLRDFDGPADPRQADRVIGAALARARLSKADRRSDGRTVWVAAAALLLLTAGLVLLAPRRTSEENTALITRWTLSSHVPTNGELLAAFGGYGR
jgi:hypothetical protein